ncbi:hypothetical protein [Streptomyces sp. NPDC050264]|uniref:hypothetical protein n=1 Tax=Streptomyces sp. NPDC050264 TaxID=3155038 RepID=UPI00343AF99F
MTPSKPSALSKTDTAMVEVHVDDGPWEEARLTSERTRDNWRQISRIRCAYPWQAPEGGHNLTVRTALAHRLSLIRARHQSA